MNEAVAAEEPKPCYKGAEQQKLRLEVGENDASYRRARRCDRDLKYPHDQVSTDSSSAQ